jgi:hypothetical protein
VDLVILKNLIGFHSRNAFIGNNDNVALVNALKTEMHAQLAENPEFAALASEMQKYSSAYDADLAFHTKVDALTKDAE